jgi:hypothetical protein
MPVRWPDKLAVVVCASLRCGGNVSVGASDKQVVGCGFVLLHLSLFASGWVRF